jgi:hypothetical protein
MNVANIGAANGAEIASDSDPISLARAAPVAVEVAVAVAFDVDPR